MSSGTRFPARTRDEMPTQAEKDIHDVLQSRLTGIVGEDKKEVFCSPDGKLLGHFQTATYTPGFSKSFYDTIGQLYALPIEPNVREICVLLSAAYFKSKYPAYVRAPMVKQFTTLTTEQTRALMAGERPVDLKKNEEITFDILHELQVTRGPLSDETFNKAVHLLGKEHTLSVIYFAGLYSMISILANGADVGLPYGEEDVVVS